jgi:hypothetical protein
MACTDKLAWCLVHPCLVLGMVVQQLHQYFRLVFCTAQFSLPWCHVPCNCSAALSVQSIFTTVFPITAQKEHRICVERKFQVKSK